jgi:replication fork clamp-binding protein CrfC
VALEASVRRCSQKVCYYMCLRFCTMLKTITGREAVFLRDRVDVLKLRLLAVKSKQCATKKNKYHCPEVFLDAVADKLTTTADLFLDAELLSKFYSSVPPAREVT